MTCFRLFDKTLSRDLLVSDLILLILIIVAQWILQDQYGYQPFEDFLTYTIKMKKTWKK